MDEAQRAEFLKQSGVPSALDKIVKTGFKTLCLEYFFTCGKDEVRAWVIQVNYKVFY